MDPDIYRVYYKLERDHWWNQAKRDIVLSVLEQYCSFRIGSKIADIGAGTGSYSEALLKKGVLAEAHDSSALAIENLRRAKIPFAQKAFPDDYRNISDRYDAILLLDVLEHIADDRSAIDVALRMLKPGGVLVCTVPACRKMWGEYDVVAHHQRRYDLGEVRALFSGRDNLHIEKLSYYSAILFPILFSVRFVENFFYRRFRKKATFRPHFVPKFLNQILYFVFIQEKALLKRMNFVLGSAIIAVLRKN